MWAWERVDVYDKHIAEFPVRCWFTAGHVASSTFSHIRTKNYVRLAPAGGCGYNPRETSYGTWWVMWKTGIPVGFMGWSRVTSDRPRRASPGEDQPGSLPRTTATKKDKRSSNGDNSCGIANEPSGHPNDGWLGGPEPELFGLRYVSRKFHFLARPFPPSSPLRRDA